MPYSIAICMPLPSRHGSYHPLIESIPIRSVDPHNHCTGTTYQISLHPTSHPMIQIRLPSTVEAQIAWLTYIIVAWPTEMILSLPTKLQLSLPGFRDTLDCCCSLFGYLFEEAVYALLYLQQCISTLILSASCRHPGIPVHSA